MSDDPAVAGPTSGGVPGGRSEGEPIDRERPGEGQPDEHRPDGARRTTGRRGSRRASSAAYDTVGHRPARHAEPSGEPASDQTRDDTDLGWSETPDAPGRDDERSRWLREQRPPHWG